MFYNTQITFCQHNSSGGGICAWHRGRIFNVYVVLQGWAGSPGRGALNLGFFRIQAGVVMNDAPTLGQTPEDQREDSAEFIRGPLEMPSAKNESGES